MATSLNQKCCRSSSHDDEWPQSTRVDCSVTIQRSGTQWNKCFVPEYCWQHSWHKYVLSAVIVLCQMFSSPLRLFLAYTAQCYRSYYVHTVCSRSLLNMHHCGSSRLNVTCPNDHGCTNQQPVRSWQHSGSHARISAAAHTVCSCSLPYLGWLCVTVCCMLLLTAYIKNPLYGG